MPSSIAGRERETRRLSDRLDAAVAGQGGLVLVTGETGIGKTTLLTNLASEARDRGIPVLTGAADVLASAPPYGLWIDLFRSWGGDNKLPDLPGWLDLDSSMARVDTRAALFHEIHQFFASATSDTPILMILEDLHRADSASLEFLRYLNRHLRSLPILLAASIRNDELSEHAPLYQYLPELARESTLERIQLGRLGENGVRTLISDRYELPQDDEQRLIGYVTERAEGNPLFITELLRVLEDEQIIEIRDGRWTLGALDQVPVPPLVRQTIDGRLKHLDDDVRWLISIAALLGRQVPIDTLRQVAGVDAAQLDYALHAAEEQNIVVQTAEGAVVFTHALFREVLDAGIILPRKRTLHLQIAEALMSDPEQAVDSDRIAYHLWSARDGRAGEWLVRAGERASDVYAYEVAEERLNRALQLKDSLSDHLRMRAHRLRGTAREMMGRFDEAIADRQSTLSLAREMADSGEIWRSLIELGDLWTARDYREVEAYHRRALDLARNMEDSTRLAHSLNRIGNWYTNIDQPQDGLRYHSDALKLFQHAGDEAGVARSLDLQAIASYLHGDMPASAEYYRRAVRLFREQNDRHGIATSLPILMMTGGSYDTETVAVAQGSDEEWFRFGYEGLQVAREIGWRAGEAFILSHFGLALGIRGDYHLALDYARRGLDLSTSIDHREWITASHYALGVVLVDCLNTRSGIEHLRRAYDSAVANHSLFWTRASAAALAWAYLIDDELPNAIRMLDTTVDAGAGVDCISLRQCWFRRAETELQRSSPGTALEIVDRLIATVPGTGADQSVPHLGWLRGRILTATGQYDEAREVLESARNRADELGYRPLLWRIDLAIGQLFEHSGSRQAMAEALNRGCDAVVDLASQIEDQAIRIEFQDRAMSMLRAPSNTNRGSRNPFGLSRREREVLALVAQGKTDGEVGEQLSISPRTVGRHLQSIYNKFGVNSRTAAVRLSIERGLI